LVKIKICGLSRSCDIDAANAAKPDYIGFVFAKSQRKVTPDQAFTLRQSLTQGIIPVGVFVNESINTVLSMVTSGIIDVIQLHGDENEAYIQTLRTKTTAPIIKAVPVLKAGDAQSQMALPADFLLLDQKGGGSGRPFDWTLIGELERPFFLAGGLDIDNITTAVQSTSPFAVDISSGVETDGLKDFDKIQAIVRKVRKAI